MDCWKSMKAVTELWCLLVSNLMTWMKFVPWKLRPRHRKNSRKPCRHAFVVLSLVNHWRFGQLVGPEICQNHVTPRDAMQRHCCINNSMPFSICWNHVESKHLKDKLDLFHRFLRDEFDPVPRKWRLRAYKSEEMKRTRAIGSRRSSFKKKHVIFAHASMRTNRQRKKKKRKNKKNGK